MSFYTTNIVYYIIHVKSFLKLFFISYLSTQMRKLIFLLIALPIWANAQQTGTPPGSTKPQIQAWVNGTGVNAQLAFYFGGSQYFQVPTIKAFLDSLTAVRVSAGAVKSVFGRTGIVTAQSSDYAGFYYPLSTNPSGYLNSETDPLYTANGVPKTRTINGYPLSSNITLTKSDVGLSNVDNTTDLNKTVSNATQTALNLKSDKVNFINAKDLGWIGDASTNQTSLINGGILANDGGSIYIPKGTYLVDTLINKGTYLYGPGRIIKNVPYGSAQINLPSDENKKFFGEEYLSRWRKQLIAGAAVKALFSGNSTTYGDATSDPFHLNNILSKLYASIGITNATWVNAGHSGQYSDTWLTTYLAQDMAQNPDLYIIDWAINDATSYANTDTAAQKYVNNIEAGLKRIRGGEFGKTQAAMSVVLSSGNTTRNDFIGHKGQAYNVRVSKLLKELARKYQCVFIDKFNAFPDAENPFVGEYVNRDMLDATHPAYVHPLDNFNALIASLYFDAITPAYFKTGATGINNPMPSLPNGTKALSDLPTTYPTGVSLDFAGSDGAWPFLGTLITFRQKSGTTYQILSSYNLPNGNIQTLKRSGFTDWSDWESTRSVNTLTLSSTPDQYPLGVTQYNVLSVNGWPANGLVINYKQINGPSVQYFYTNGTTDGSYYVRYGAASAWNGALILVSPSSAITTNTDQASLSGNKKTAGAWTMGSSSVLGNDAAFVFYDRINTSQFFSWYAQSGNASLYVGGYGGNSVNINNTTGVWSFPLSPIVPTPTTATQAANKAYVDGSKTTFPIRNVTTASSSTDRTVTPSDYTITVDASGGMVTLNFYTFPVDGELHYIKKVDATSNIVRLAPPTTIDGVMPLDIATPNQTICIQYQQSISAWIRL